MINVGYAPTPVTVRLRVDILGYFDGQPANAESTLLLARIYDSGVAPQVDIPAGATVDVPVNGVQGVPAYSASISGVTLHFETGGAWDPAGGSLIAWPSDATMPTAPVVTHGPGSAQSDLAILRPGPDGKIKIKNSTPSGSLRVLIDVQGYFTNTENLPPAVGLNPVSSGSRASAQIDGGRYGN